MVFAQALECVDDTPAHQAEVAGVDRDVDRGQPAQAAVEERGARLLEQGLALTARALAVDDVEALLAPQAEHLGDHFRRILEVGVDDDNGLPARVVEPGGDGELVAEVAREGDEAEARVFGLELLEQRAGPVGAAVVDEHDLEGLAERLEHIGEAGVELREDLLLVEAGDDDREGRSHGAPHGPGRRAAT